MAKLLSSTGKTTADVSSDGNSLIMQSVGTEAQVFWPMKDWEDLKAFIEGKLKPKDDKI